MKCTVCGEEDPYQGLWKHECFSCYDELNNNDKYR